MLKTSGILSLWRVAMWGGAAVLLALPAIAMAFFPDAGVNWTGSDFVAAALMLFIAGVTVEIGAYLADDLAYFGGVIFAAGTGLVTVWVNGAVGMIQDEGNALNLVFLLVISFAVAASLFVRFKARGMARAMLATAALQAAIGIYVFAGGLDDLFTAALITGFALPWCLAAGLFHLSANNGGDAFARAS
jgi:hypothetical protein